MGRPIVELKHIEKYYGTNHVIKDLNLAIAPGEFLTLLGPSGCGKTTTLRMISGFEAPTSGEIDLSGESVAHRAPNERDVNTVFQNYALFPNMTVAENIAYGLKVKKVPKAKIKKRVAEMLKLVQLTGFEKRKPSQLSGGQKQRVAIARALAGEPKVLLLDEPLGALDYKLRKQMQVELKHLQKRLGITFVFVTHDQEEALTMSDRIAVMNGGRIEQLGTPHAIYDHPATPFVAGFIGESNPFDAVVNTFPDASEQTLTLGTENGIISVAKPGDSAFSFGDLVKVSVRPEKLCFSKTPVKGFGIRGVVRDHLFVGNMVKMIVALNDGSKVRLSRVDADEFAPVGDVVYLYFKPEDARVFATKTWFKTDAQRDLKEVIDEANATHFG